MLACYVALFLLRKRLARGDRLQTFADIYATALRVRDMVFAACYADRPVRGWRDLPPAAERSADPDLVLKSCRFSPSRTCWNWPDSPIAWQGLKIWSPCWRQPFGGSMANCFVALGAILAIVLTHHRELFSWCGGNCRSGVSPLYTLALSQPPCQKRSAKITPRNATSPHRANQMPTKS